MTISYGTISNCGWHVFSGLVFNWNVLQSCLSGWLSCKCYLIAPEPPSPLVLIARTLNVDEAADEPSGAAQDHSTAAGRAPSLDSVEIKKRSSRHAHDWPCSIVGAAS